MNCIIRTSDEKEWIRDKNGQTKLFYSILIDEKLKQKKSNNRTKPIDFVKSQSFHLSFRNLRRQMKSSANEIKNHSLFCAPFKWWILIEFYANVNVAYGILCLSLLKFQYRWCTTCEWGLCCINLMHAIVAF